MPRKHANARKSSQPHHVIRYAGHPVPQASPHGPLPEAFTNTLKYAAYDTIDPGIGVAGFHMFSCNGIYDPDVTGTGHQPMYFDDMMELYQHYTVLSSKIKVSFLNGAESCIIGVAVLGAVTGSTDLTRLIEYPMSHSKPVFTAGNVVPRPVDTEITAHFNAQSFFNKTRSSMLGAGSYTGNVSANPAEQAYFCVFIGPADEATNLSETGFRVEIEYRCVFSEIHLRTTSLGAPPPSVHAIPQQPHENSLGSSMKDSEKSAGPPKLPQRATKEPPVLSENSPCTRCVTPMDPPMDPPTGL